MKKPEETPEPRSTLHGLLRPGFWILVVTLLAADLLSKDWAWQYAGEGDVELLGDWLSLHTVYNPGGVFGIAQDFTVPLTIVRSLAVLVIVYLVGRQPRGNGLGVFTLALLLAGALGNLYDNLSRWAPWDGTGEVRDFMKVDLGFWPFDPWPIFNLADSCITVGFILLITGLAKIHLRAHPAPATES